jgi:hypothetical protein
MELIVNHNLELSSNLDDIEKSIKEQLEVYKTVAVSEDTLSDAKELMAKLNKEKKEFSEKCKSFLNVVSSPLDAFKKRQKEIESLFESSRDDIKKQVDFFELKKLDEIKTLVFDFRDKTAQFFNISVESIIVNDLVMLSAATINKSGYSLTKAIKEKIESRAELIYNEVLKKEAEAKAEADRIALIKERAITEERIEAARRAEVQRLEFEKKEKEIKENHKKELELLLKAPQKIEEKIDQVQKNDDVVNDNKEDSNQQNNGTCWGITVHFELFSTKSKQEVFDFYTKNLNLHQSKTFRNIIVEKINIKE